MESKTLATTGFIASHEFNSLVKISFDAKMREAAKIKVKKIIKSILRISLSPEKNMSLHCNLANSFLYANGAKIHQFKAKDNEIRSYPLCLGNISNHFAIDNLKKFN